jgi:hypothetical protein
VGLGAWVFLANPFSADSGLVRNASLAFMEDLQFKDFRSSSLYHHELERDRVDIGRTLEKLFLVKPELLDIIDYRIAKLDIDKSGDRARVLVRSRYKRLNYDEKPQDGEILLYWIKRHPQCPLGGKCQGTAGAGQCVNEFGKVILKPKDEKKKEDSQAQLKGDAANPDLSEEHFVCDPEREPQWAMNLDSTLKEKRYNY